jgi:outer membrane protein insertion porin family
MLITLILTFLAASQLQTQSITVAPAVSRQEAVQQQQADKDLGEVKREILIRFEGNKIFSSDELREHLEYSKETVSVPRVRTKDSLRQFVDEDLRLVTFYVRSKGYLQARFAEPRIQYPCVRTDERDGRSPTPPPLHPVMCVDVSLEEGKLFRLGRINIEGNEVLSEQYIRSAIGLQTGEVVNGQRIGKALYEDLKALYGQLGFIQYEADVQPSFRENPQNPLEGISDFDITITEGRQFRISSIRFEGDARAPEDLLRRALLINEGDVYNQALFEKSIEKINDLALVEYLDKDRDVVFDSKKYEENAKIDIIIHIKDRTQRAN